VHPPTTTLICGHVGWPRIDYDVVVWTTEAHNAVACKIAPHTGIDVGMHRKVVTWRHIAGRGTLLGKFLVIHIKPQTRGNVFKHSAIIAACWSIAVILSQGQTGSWSQSACGMMHRNAVTNFFDLNDVAHDGHR